MTSPTKKLLPLTELTEERIKEIIGSMTEAEKKKMADSIINAVNNVKSSIEEDMITGSERDKILNTPFEIIPQH